MRLAYITTATMSLHDAQSLQISAMAQAFSQLLYNDFIFISPRSVRNTTEKVGYRWIQLRTIMQPRIIRYLFVILRSRKVSAAFKPDCIYTRDIGVAAWYHLAGFRVCYEMHKPFVTLAGQALFRLFASKIKIIFISRALKDMVTDRYALLDKNLYVAHDGVWTNDFKGTIKNREQIKQNLFGVKNGVSVIMYSGTFQPGKGLDVILLLADYFAKNNAPIIFACLGGERPRSCILKNILFIPRVPQPQVVSYLKVADILLLPNTTELSYFNYTSPLKLFEYMASGTPFVVSRSQSITEIANEKNAWLFDPGDVGQCIAQIKNVLSNPVAAKQRAEQALGDVARYDWQNRCQNIVQFLEIC
ncbi:MAG: glycosyltransferase [Candidatus Magasanikbacteria bacterium]|nr:glycosyltransferase [Candidatus Magasanikbacteria bacterium]